MERLNILDWLSGGLTLLGALYWGVAGALNYDLMASWWGVDSLAYRTVATIVALSALYAVVDIILRSSSGVHHQASAAN